MANYLVYDLEIVKAIPPIFDSGRIPGVEYCQGWEDHKGMGISVIGACHITSGGSLPRFRVFTEDNFADFEEATVKSDFVIGYNNHRFDDTVIRETLGFEIPEDKSVDILRQIWKALRLPIDFTPPISYGYGLDAVAQFNVGLAKTGKGESAPHWWQAGEIGKVIDYCLADVQITAEIWAKILREGTLINPKTKERFDIPLRGNMVKRSDRETALEGVENV